MLTKREYIEDYRERRARILAEAYALESTCGWSIGFLFGGRRIDVSKGMAADQRSVGLLRGIIAALARHDAYRVLACSEHGWLNDARSFVGSAVGPTPVNACPKNRSRGVPPSRVVI
jgi:hypothetical protein